MEQGEVKRAGPAGASRNLSDRVRSLRLSDRGGQRPPRSRLLPWAVALVLLLTATAFGYRAYRVGGLAAESPGRDEKKQAGKDSPLPSGSTTAAVGDVVLQAKGYVIPISLVQVSPKVGGQLIEIDPRFRE